MPPETRVEDRLKAVEAAVADLQRRVSSSDSAPNWLDQVVGTFKDEPAFEEVLAYGRAFRASDRPAGDDEP